MKYELGVCSKCHQEKKIKDKKLNLCSTCYNKTKEVIGICSECKEEKVIKNKEFNLCTACYARKLRSQPGYKAKVRMGVCSSCHRERPLVTKDDLCNSCHVREYKRRTGYKGPVRACIVCGKITNIHSNNMCQSCYNKKYAEENHDKILENKRRNRAADPEKFRNWDRNWKRRNREHFKALRKARYWDDPEKSRAKARLRFLEKREAILIGRRIKRIEAARKLNINPSELNQLSKLNELKKNIPDLKYPWINEFLDTVYAEKAYKTKLKFLQDINRLLDYVKKNNGEAYYGGWNMLSLTDIEKCQVETGILKDSLRVFFRWLKNRKYITIDLQEAIPSGTRNWQFTEITTDSLSAIAKRFYNDDMPLYVKLAGLFIVFFLLTNEQLRALEVSHFKNRKIFINSSWHDVDEKVWILIEEYLKWRQDFYLGYAPKYFFVTGYTIASQKMVSITYFSSVFRRENIGISPSNLRKAMIYFHKNKTGMDPFALGAIAGIQPRSATRY